MSRRRQMSKHETRNILNKVGSKISLVMKFVSLCNITKGNNFIKKIIGKM